MVVGELYVMGESANMAEVMGGSLGSPVEKVTPDFVKDETIEGDIDGNPILGEHWYADGAWKYAEILETAESTINTTSIM